MKIRLLVLNKGGGSIIKSMIKWRKSATECNKLAAKKTTRRQHLLPNVSQFHQAQVTPGSATVITGDR